MVSNKLESHLFVPPNQYSQPSTYLGNWGFGRASQFRSMLSLAPHGYPWMPMGTHVSNTYAWAPYGYPNEMHKYPFYIIKDIDHE